MSQTVTEGTTIRGAELSDAGQLAAFWNEFLEGLKPASAIEIGGILRSEREVIFLARAKGALVGSVHGTKVASAPGESAFVILSLAIEPAYQRDELPRRMVDVAEAWAIAQGCTMCGVGPEPVMAGSPHFWSSLGYVFDASTAEFRKRLERAPNASRGLALANAD
jgi:ribosomal protein S18 acetylase RimI-like enzyme